MRRVKTILSVIFFLITAHAAIAANPEADKDLIYRASFGRGTDISILIERGANPEVVNEKGLTALMIAAQRTDDQAVPVLKALVDGGAKLETVDAQGQTALFYAATRGNAKTTQFLLEQGAQYYKPDHNGNIPRTLANNAGHTEIVALMDKFVETSTDKRLEEYKKYEELVQAHNKAIIDKRAEEALKQQEAADAKKAAQAEAIARKKAEIAEIAAQRSPERFQQLVYDLSFNACSFQYWYYVRTIQLKTAYSIDQLDKMMKAHTQKISEIRKEMRTIYNANREYQDKVVLPSQRRITNTLRRFGSRDSLKTNDVGTPEDVRRRCDPIALSWDAAPAARANNPQPNRQTQQQKKKQNQQQNMQRRWQQQQAQ